MTLIANGQSTGLADSDGTVIHFGDVLIAECHNAEVHGDKVWYRVVALGTVPVLMYLKSAKGQILPVDYSRGFLADEYDRKTFLWIKDPSMLRPDERFMRVLSKESAQKLLAEVGIHD